MTAYVATRRRLGAGLLALTTASAAFLLFAPNADAAIVPTVPLGTASSYSVLAGSTVTNTGPSVLNRSLGLSPGLDAAITGFPPGLINGQRNAGAAAAGPKADLTNAYNNAAGRPIDFTETVDLGGKNLGAGVYVSDLGPLMITGPLILNGAGNPNSVFIFKASSTLITASSSTVSLINGAQECNVFWQVGSSATLGSDSVFRGTIMALSSITVNTNVTVHGRALARNAAVTLDDDVFVSPTCATGGGTTPTTAPPGGTTVTTAPGGGTTSGTTPGGGSSTGTGTGTGTGLNSGPGVPGVSGPPRTGGAPLQRGSAPWVAVLFVTLLGAGTAGTLLRRRTPGQSSVEHSSH